MPPTRENGRWPLDLDAFRKVIARRTKVLLFYNPHNPVGRAFGREELAAVAEICVRHGLWICSDGRSSASRYGFGQMLYHGSCRTISIGSRRMMTSNVSMWIG